MVRDYFAYPYSTKNSTFRIYRELIDSAFRGFEDSENLKVNETATITMRKNGKIYQIKINDITSDMESKDEVISIEINKEQPSKPSDKDKHPYFPE